MGDYLKQRRKGWAFQMRVPPDVRVRLGKGPVINEGLDTRDRDLAEARAAQRAGYYKLTFEALRGDSNAAADLRRAAYEKAGHDLEQSRPEEYSVQVADDESPSGEDSLSGIYLGLEANEAAAIARGWRDDGRDSASNPMPPDLQAQRDALVDRQRRLEGRPVERRAAYALSFRECASRYLAGLPSGTHSLQTVSQHEAVHRLFGDYIGTKPFAKVTRADAALFMDEIRKLDPLWGRSPLTKQRTFAEIKALYPAKGKRMSNRTLVRYMNHLAPVWTWAEDRGEVSGKNPFAKLVKKERGKAQLYQPFTPEELNMLFGMRTARAWLWEVALVGLYSGMRANEICSLAWSDIKRSPEGVMYFDITGAKTEAGERPVPVHSKLAWLLERRPKSGRGQVWPTLIPGGPDGKHSHYYSKQFTEWRRKRGIPDGVKVFHSLRKNAVQCLERAGVEQTEAAQIVGHEREGITYSVYSPGGLTMPQRRDIVEKIKYPGLKHPRLP